VIINGRAFDDLVPFCSPGFDCGVDRVDLQIINSAGLYMDSFGGFGSRESWIEAFLTNPTGQFSNWNYATPDLTDDIYTIQARARDLHGQYDQEVNDTPITVGDVTSLDFVTITVGTGVPPENPALSLSSSATPATFTAQGQVIAESFVLTNTGNVTLDGPFTVTSDQGNDPVSCPGNSTLAVGASITCTASNFISNAEFNAGQSVTVATGHGEHNGGVVDSNEDTLTVAAAGPTEIAFRASRSSSDRAITHTIRVPNSVQAGDVMLMFVSVANETEQLTRPSGWTQLNSRKDDGLKTFVFMRVANGSDAGRTYTVQLEASRKADLLLVAYSGVDTADPILELTHKKETLIRANHRTPELTTAVNDAWILQYWAHRANDTTSMTTEWGRTRHEGANPGASGLFAVMADTNGPRQANTFGKNRATADTTSARATMWVIALNPAD
jgi:hypothetical protein